METKRKRKRIDSLEKHVKRFRNRFGELDKHIEALNNLVGMHSVKKAILGQLKYLLCAESAEGHFLNTCICGPPGSGKTTLAKTLFELWTSLRLFENAKFTVLSRADLVAPYLGQTASRAKRALMKHKGSVIFIDEFYSLVNSDTDAYGIEALTVLNSFMSENVDTVIIVAGYQKEVDKIFEMQPGLHRRFAWRFKIEPYSGVELFAIFKSQLKEHGWTVDPQAIELFKTKKFKYGGGDTLNIALKAKIKYSTRNWLTGGNKRLLYSDVERAINSHIVEEEVPVMYM